MSSTLTFVGLVISVAAPVILAATALITIADLRKNHSRDREKIERLKRQKAKSDELWEEHTHQGVY